MNTQLQLSELPPVALVAIGLLTLVQIGLQVAALIDLVRRPEERVVSGKKWLWALLIVFGQIIGSILYFAIGRVPAPAEQTPSRASTDTRDAADRAADELYGGR